MADIRPALVYLVKQLGVYQQLINSIIQAGKILIEQNGILHRLAKEFVAMDWCGSGKRWQAAQLI